MAMSSRSGPSLSGSLVLVLVYGLGPGILLGVIALIVAADSWIPKAGAP
jgi:hypothetical protein